MRKCLNYDEKSVIIMGRAKGISFHVIVEKLYRHVDTLKRFMKDRPPRKKRSDCETSHTVTAMNMTNISRQLRRIPGQIRKSILTTLGFSYAPKTHQKCTYRSMAFVREHPKLHFLTSCHINLRFQETQKYPTLDMICDLFNDETKVKPDEPDDLAND